MLHAYSRATAAHSLIFQPIYAGCPVAAQPSASSSSCPVVGGESYNPNNNMPEIPNAPMDSRGLPLSSQRETSSIPTASSDLPKHQGSGAGAWVYPSEQMFYNAMKRKVMFRAALCTGQRPAGRPLCRSTDVVGMHVSAAQQQCSRLLFYNASQM